MQEAIVTCTRAAGFGTSCIIDIKWAALVQVTIACCIGHSNGACAYKDPFDTLTYSPHRKCTNLALVPEAAVPHAQSHNLASKHCLQIP